MVKKNHLTGKQQRVLVIGAGSIGTRHLRVIHGLGYEVLACDPQTKAFEAIRAQIPALRTYADLSAALAQQPDFAVVATPPVLHAGHTIAAMRSGAHVLCEKPMADTVHACNRMVAAAEKYGKVLHIGFVNRYHPGVRRLKEAASSGALGKVLFGSADLGSYFTLMCSRSRYQAGVFGALLLDYTHQLDYMPWIMGSPVKRVYAVGSALGKFKLKSKPNMIAMILEHASGAVTEIHLDYCRHPQQGSASVTGDRGFIKVDFTANRTLTGRLTDGACGGESIIHERDDLFREQFRQFVAATQGRKADIVPGEEARRASLVAEAALKSLKTRRPEAVRQD